jgi:hypothetical protein
MITTSYSKAWSPDEALQRAATGGKIDLLKTALRAGANINHISEQDKCTALMSAAKSGHIAIVEYLLDQGAALEVQHECVEKVPKQKPVQEEQQQQQQHRLQIIDLDENSDVVDDISKQDVPEVDELNVETYNLSAAIAAAQAGWPDVLKLLVKKYKAHVNSPSHDNSYGEENALLACAHHAKLRCLHVVLNCSGAEALWPEALEHASFAPSLLNEMYAPTSSDLWWIPESSSSNSLYSPKTTTTSFSQTKKKQKDSSRTAESCQRSECRELLLDALSSQGRISECIPYIQHTWTVFMENATFDTETGLHEPTIKLLIANHVFADILERVGTRTSLLKAANLYGSAYRISKSLFGKTEITITELGHWSSCILRIKSEEKHMTHMSNMTTTTLQKEGEPMLRAALKDLRDICKVASNDPRVILWTKLLLPLQPGRAPFEPMSYLAAEETNPYYKSPPRNEHRTIRHSSDPIIPYPSEAALHPAYSPFLDELEAVNKILEQIHQAQEDLIREKNAETASSQILSEKEILVEAVKKNWRCILYADSKWRKDRLVVLTAVSYHGVALKSADIKWRNNEQICTVAVENDWRSFSYCTPKMKQKKKIFNIAKKKLIEEIQLDSEKLESWRCLEFADPMLRGNLEVVEAALKCSEDAFQFVDRYMYAESTSWLKIWPAFLRRCKHRIKVFLITTITIMSIIGVAYFLVYVVFYLLIWPPVVCKETNITYEANAEGRMIMYRVEYEVEYPNAHVCNASLYVPAPAPELQEVSHGDREAEQDDLRKIFEEERLKLKAEQAEKARRRRAWAIRQGKTQKRKARAITKGREATPSPMLSPTPAPSRISPTSRFSKSN